VSRLLYAKKSHKNDIIILFSDAEELGLNGAAFCNPAQLGKEVGLFLILKPAVLLDRVTC
jgi:putative aminopeptidase FrvX